MRRRTGFIVAAAAAAVLLGPQPASAAYVPRGLQFSPVEVKFTDDHVYSIGGLTTTYHNVLDMRFDGYRCGDGVPADKWVLGYAGSRGTGIVHEDGYIINPDGTKWPWDNTAGNFGGILTPGQSGLLAPTGYSGLVKAVIQAPSPTQTTLTVTHTYDFDQTYTESQTVPLALVRNPDCPDIYKIELKAWIPKDHVVDPTNPLPMPYDLVVRPGCYTPPTALERAGTMVTTQFRGDGHTGYDGTYRVRPWVSFAWNGYHISNFNKSDDPSDYGTTHLDWTYKIGDTVSARCTTEGTATTATIGSQVGENAFELAIESPNPMVIGAPDIDSHVTGQIDSSDAIHFKYLTDLFPSHGVQVYRNNELLATEIVNDPSCLSDSLMLSPVGALVVLAGLTSPTNQGTFDIMPDDSGKLDVSPSRLCNSWQLNITGSSGGGKRELAAARSILVAPVTAGNVGTYVTLAEAVKAGLVAASTSAGLTQIASDATQPVAVKVDGSGIVVDATTVSGGNVSAHNSYGPVNGELVAKAGGTVAVTANGRSVPAEAPDTAPPVTRATVKRHGKNAVVTFRATDASGVLTTYVTVAGNRAKVIRNTLRIRTKLLRQVRYFSIDVFGNRERLRRLPAR